MMQTSSKEDFFLLDIQDGEDKSSDLKNCIRKNYKHLKKFAKRTATNAFRIYDSEIKKYPLAIDFYANRFLVYQYETGKESLEEEVLQVLQELFSVTEKEVVFKSRFKREKLEQYEKLGTSKDFFSVLEYGTLFLVNLEDYLDTGLFLDHRETRKMVRDKSFGKRVLNLFSYTGAFSVQAAMGGALFTKSVDMSNTYTDWNRENFLLNGLSLKNNEIIRADCMRFLEEEVRSVKKYDLIVIDPPTISRSKKMVDMFDIQKDHLFLIDRAKKLLAENGEIFFSTNSRKFVLDKSIEAKEITLKTIPLDFHNRKIHRCWTIS